MGGGHSHAHGAAAGAAGHERALWGALGLTCAFLVAEVAGGLITGSLALLSDAAHMFTDVSALAVSLAATRLVRRPADRKRTYGYHRFEILAAVFNSVLLFAAAIYIVVEAWKRLHAPADVHSTGMLVVAVIGLLVNLAGMRLLAAGSGQNLNVKGAYLEVWSDMLGSIGVIVGAAVIMATGWAWFDSLVAVGIGLWVLPRTWKLLGESVNVLLEGVPEGCDLDAIEAAILRAPGVRSLHDLHLWSLASGKPSLTVHVVRLPAPVTAETVLAAVRDVVRAHGVAHSTVQVEASPCDGRDEADAIRAIHAAMPPAPRAAHSHERSR